MENKFTSQLIKVLTSRVIARSDNKIHNSNGSSQWHNCILTTHNWQKWKRVFLTCPCHDIYRYETVGLKSCKYTWKITIYVKVRNLGQFRENLIFCQKLLNWSSNLKIILHMYDTYYCDYLQHSTFRFNSINFQLNTDFPFQFCGFYSKIT